MAQTKAKKRKTTSTKPAKTTYTAARKKEILADFKLGWVSRHMSLIGRKEVLSGKAKFGIFGDGKELPQIALSKVFKNGDFRSGYYRDQTLMLAIDQLTPRQFFAQLYAHADEDQEPASSGRQMNGHFSTPLLDKEGNWIDQTKTKNSSSDISPTASQMARLLGLAQASKVYRHVKELKSKEWKKFSSGGNEIAFGTIGDSSTSEGIFWETINAAGVLQVPLVVSVWDDGYGISVEKKYQTTKESISEVLSGFQRSKAKNGFEILTVKAWDYSALLETYQQAENIARKEHVPVLVHVQEVTQPQGHSTSGSHERYKDKERLQFEEDFCCLKHFREWIIKEKIATAKALDALEEEAHVEVTKAKDEAWKAYTGPLKEERTAVLALLNKLHEQSGDDRIAAAAKKLKSALNPIRKDIYTAVRKALYFSAGKNHEAAGELKEWLDENNSKNKDRYSSHLLSQTRYSPLKVEAAEPEYKSDAENVDGRIVLRDNFDALFKKYPNTLIFGEDTGRLGDVNKGLEGLQEVHGEQRISDAGIREATILGQGIGMALRGLRPIAEIQYLDYLLYCYQLMSDDLATIRYRTKGRQAAPLIVRTRGHRLEGIWHSGSPMGVLTSGLRGIHICVPRNMTEAAGFYNTLLQGDDPALIIEPLNGYRLKEKLPENLGEFTTPLGVPEVVHEGTDLTIVSYGSTFNVVESLLPQFDEAGISAELIDARTLLPFDIHGIIGESLKKTNRLLIVDEDVPGGASAFIMQQILQEQNGYRYLDSKPVCLTSQEHRPAYASDGDYFSKPNAEDIFEAAYAVMSECEPDKFPAIF